MAIKKGISKPADPKNTPNPSGRQPVPEKTPDKRVTKKPDRGGSGDAEGILRREFRRALVKK